MCFHTSLCLFLMLCAFASMYIDMYACKYIVYVYKICEFSYAYACSSTCVYACIQMPEQDIRSLSISLHLIILRHGLSLSWKETVENCLTSHSLLCSMWGSATWFMFSIVQWFWGFKFRSSCLYIKYVYPLTFIYA